MKSIKTKKKSIGEGSPCFIAAGIAEEYNKNLDRAKILISAAAEAGCDAVRFCSKGISKESCRKIFDFCQEKNLIFYVSVFEEKDSEWLADIDIPIFKIPSEKLRDLFLVEYVAKRKKPIILSLGLASEKEIDRAVTTVYKSGNEKVILQYCVFDYPAKIEKLNLKSILYCKKNFGVPVGFSDHSEGKEASCLAVALGADIIEKHLDFGGKKRPYCLTPETIGEWVFQIRRTEKAVGRA